MKKFKLFLAIGLLVTGLSAKAECPAVTQVLVSDITHNSAKVEIVSDGSYWNLRYRVKDATKWILGGGPSKQQELTDLEPLTTYELEVQTDCSSEQSEWFKAQSFLTSAKPECPMPDFGVKSKTSTSITVTVSSTYGSYWNLRWKEDGVGADWTLGGGAQNEMTITDLKPNTKYVIQAQTSCGTEDESQWVGIEATTNPEPTCDEPSIAMTDVTATSATIKWAKGGEETAWKFQYKKGGEEYSDANILDANEPQITIANLDPSTTYIMRVKAVCDETHSSDWSSEGQFTTAVYEPEGYVIVAKRSSGNYFYMTTDLGTTSTPRYQAVDAGTDELTSVPYANLHPKYYWQIKDNKYLMSGDQYSSWKNNTNSANFTTEEEKALVLDIKWFAADNYYTFSFDITTNSGVDTRYLALNNTASNNYFAYYKGTAQIEELYLIPAKNGLTDISNVQSDKVQCTKVLRDGQLLLIRDGKTYNVLGTEMR